MGEEAQVRAPKFDVATTTSTKEAACAPTSTPSSPHFTSGWTISCPSGPVPAGRPSSLTQSSSPWPSQVFLDCPNDRKFLAFARWRLGHLFPYLPKQPSYNKRVRALAPQILGAINALAFSSAGLCDRLWLLDSTPVPCGQSRATARRSELAGHAAYGYRRSHSRFF